MGKYTKTEKDSALRDEARIEAVDLNEQDLENVSGGGGVISPSDPLGEGNKGGTAPLG